MVWRTLDLFRVKCDTGGALRKHGLIAFLACLVVVVASCANGVTPTTCDPGAVLCGDVCSTVADDPENCGACGTTCPSAQACVAGTCTTTCPTNNKMCAKDGGAGVCVNAQTD